MTEQSNPRKISKSGGLIAVSLPKADLDRYPVEVGDRVVLTPTDTGFIAEKVEWEVTGDE